MKSIHCFQFCSLYIHQSVVIRSISVICVLFFVPCIPFCVIGNGARIRRVQRDKRKFVPRSPFNFGIEKYLWPTVKTLFSIQPLVNWRIANYLWYVKTLFSLQTLVARNNTNIFNLITLFGFYCFPVKFNKWFIFIFKCMFLWCSGWSNNIIIFW
jgi:hypothetical protein